MRLEDFIVGGYVLGIPLDWAYWVAHGVEPAGSQLDPNWLGAFVGVIVSPVWPLHILVEAWFWILG